MSPPGAVALDPLPTEIDTSPLLSQLDAPVASTKQPLLPADAPDFI